MTAQGGSDALLDCPNQPKTDLIYKGYNREFVEGAIIRGQVLYRDTYAGRRTTSRLDRNSTGLNGPRPSSPSFTANCGRESRIASFGVGQPDPEREYED